MRVTNSSITDRFLTNVQRSYRDMARLQEQISSGQRVNRPSDDPLAAAQARLRQVDLDQIASDKRSATSATDWLTATETGLSQINDLLQRARELTVLGANSTYSQFQRDAIASEIDQLLAQAKQVMGSKSGEAYIFSGTKTDTAPYNTGSDTYQGDGNAVNRGIGNGTTVAVTVSFNGVGSASPMTLTAQTLSANLRAGNVAALGTSDLRNLKANLDAVANARAAVGATQNRVDISIARMDQLSLTATQVIGDLTGTDYTKAITEFNAQQNAYVAALKSGATLVQTSLLDFIR